MSFKIVSICQLLLLLVLQTSLSEGHTFLHSITAGGKEQTECIRYYPAPDKKNFPVKNIEGSEMMCNAGTSPAKQNCPISAGETVTLQYYHVTPSPGDMILDRSHKGPFAIYLAQSDANGNPGGWFKIFEKGYDSASGKWASDELIDSRGKLSVPIPKGLQNGRYLLRAEFIALHEANGKYNEDPGRGAQLYITCTDIVVSGGSGTIKPSTVTIPSAQWATFDSPGIHFNLYDGTPHSSYKIPGPPVVTSQSTTDNSSDANQTSSPPSQNSEPPASQPQQNQQPEQQQSESSRQPAAQPQASEPKSNPSPWKGGRRRRRKGWQRNY
ncbi:glycosyl hydrolase family 61-domain-containing protein [Paraphysoderma sedebokerense]|nr:glycosyl hydrolase family 61-domain-containing protein [Paraphysoderma sedebokerense]